MALSACWIVRFSPRIEKPATISNPKAIPLLTLFLVTTIQIACFKRKYGQRENFEFGQCSCSRLVSKCLCKFFHLYSKF